MAHLTDYVGWRGDISFADRGFRIEDNLVLSELVYIDYKPVMEGRVSMSLGEAIRELDKAGILKSTRAGSAREDLDFARSCGESKRFGTILLKDFRDEYDSSDRQFAAVTYELDNGLSVIAYRGTDSTIIGWKEDFMISYTNVPSQYLALDYARKHVDEAEGEVIILGHSKGAHLALYAAAYLDGFEKKPHENPAIGLILCKDMNKSFVDYVIQDYSKPIGVATYKTSRDMSEELRKALPDIEELKRLLDTEDLP